MTSTPPEQPESGDTNEPTVPLEGGEPDYGRVNPPPPGYGPPPGGYPPPGYVYGAHAGAPWGVHPVTGVPYSEKQKLIAGLLNILLPFGIGRFYIGDTGTAVAQLLVAIFTCGIGTLWSLIDGVLMLTGDPYDAEGRPLRP